MINFNLNYPALFILQYRKDIVRKTITEMDLFISEIKSGFYQSKFRKTFTHKYIKEIILSNPQELTIHINKIYSSINILADYYYPEFLFANVIIPNEIKSIGARRKPDKERIIDIKKDVLRDLRNNLININSPLILYSINKLKNTDSPKDIRNYLQHLLKIKEGSYKLNNKEISIQFEWLDGFSKVFNYDAMANKYGFAITEKLGINVCLYCNKEKIQIIKGDKNVRPDLDHFYPKSKFPFLAVSLSNLVPSGSICNQSYKKSKSMLDHVHPFIFGINDQQKIFNVFYPPGKILLSENIKIKIIKQGGIIDNNFTTFELDSVYNCDDELKDWVEMTYSKSEFFKNVKGNFQQIFREDNEYKIYVDLSKKPYKVSSQKFKIDVINQFSGKNLKLPI